MNPLVAEEKGIAVHQWEWPTTSGGSQREETNNLTSWFGRQGVAQSVLSMHMTADWLESPAEVSQPQQELLASH